MRRPIRSLAAVVAGMVVLVAVSAVLDKLLLAATGVPAAPPPAGQPGAAHGPLAGSQFIIELVANGSAALVGGYLAAWLAPTARAGHAYALAAIPALLGASLLLGTFSPGVLPQELTIKGVATVACVGGGLLAARVLGHGR